jgi:hypothetical protein
LFRSIDTKDEGFLVADSGFLINLGLRSIVAPNPLHKTDTIEPISKPKNPNNMARIGTLRLIARNVTPPTRPRFSVTVESAK